MRFRVRLLFFLNIEKFKYFKIENKRAKKNSPHNVQRVLNKGVGGVIKSLMKKIIGKTF